MNFCFCLVLYRLKFDDFFYLQSIHKYVIAIYMVEDCLGIVFDTEEVMKTWLEMLISCQMGGRSIEGIYIFSFFHLFFIFQKKETCKTPIGICYTYHICYFDLLSFDENFWRGKYFNWQHSKNEVAIEKNGTL